jgi:hypothetical protein
MKVIRIDRKSISKNPTAGATETTIQGAITAKFSIEANNIPSWIYEPPFIPTASYIPIYNESKGGILDGKVEGYINSPIDEELIDKCTKIGMDINIERELKTFQHRPEPEYLYDYVETYLKCKYCKNLVEVEDIEEDYYITDEDDIRVETCPICKHDNTFPERRYEKIEDVLKTL